MVTDKVTDWIPLESNTQPPQGGEYIEVKDEDGETAIATVNIEEGVFTKYRWHIIDNDNIGSITHWRYIEVE